MSRCTHGITAKARRMRSVDADRHFRLGIVLPAGLVPRASAALSTLEFSKRTFRSWSPSNHLETRCTSAGLSQQWSALLPALNCLVEALSGAHAFRNSVTQPCFLCAIVVLLARNLLV